MAIKRVIRSPKLHVFLDSAKWTHVIASWLAAIIAAICFVFQSNKMQPTDWFLMFCGVFLSPLLFPFAWLFQSGIAAVITLAIYAVAFCIVWPVARRKVSAYQKQPKPPEMTPTKCESKILLVAICAGGLALLTQIAVCGGATYTGKTMAKWEFWLMPIPALIAAGTGLAACMVTQSGSQRHSNAFACLIVGIVLSILSLFILYLKISGMAEYA